MDEPEMCSAAYTPMHASEIACQSAEHLDFVALPSQVVAVNANGGTSPVSAAVPVTTPAADQPVVVSATPTSPTTATTVITPPATGGPYPTYNVTMCPSSGNGTCVTATCTDPTNCPVTGLQPGTTYTTTVSLIRDCMPACFLLLRGSKHCTYNVCKFSVS